MLVTYPVNASDYALLVIGVAAITVGISALFPLRWGWKAFPAIALVLASAAALVFATAIMFPGIIFGDHGGSFVLRPVAIPVTLLAAALAFGVSLAARRARRRAI
jgi:hypothetical protein